MLIGVGIGKLRLRHVVKRAAEGTLVIAVRLI
jgi:hypothetical protein